MANSPDTMKAAAIDRFGGPDELTLHTLPMRFVRERAWRIRTE